MMSDTDKNEFSVRTNKYWGEISDHENICEQNGHLFPNVSEDIRRSMQKDCLDKYPDDGNMMQIREIKLPPPDPLVVHAIHLHNWMRDMTETISVAKVAAENHIISPEDAKNPIPRMPNLELKHKPNTLNFIPPKSTQELKESIQNDEIPELSQLVVKQILAKSVVLLAAQIGIEESNQSVVDTLVDVLHDFYTKICDRFVSALEEEIALDVGGFPNAIERVLVEKGLGGAKGLHEYYQSRVVNYIKVLRNRCRGLEGYYSSMLNPEPEPVID